MIAGSWTASLPTCWPLKATAMWNGSKAIIRTMRRTRSAVLASTPTSRTASSTSASRAPDLLRGEFGDQRRAGVDVFQRFGNGGGRDRNRAVDAAVIAEDSAKAVNIAVENRAHHAAIRRDNRRTGIA